MKVLFLTASTSRNAGGLFFTITNYTQSLKNLGVDVEVFGIDDEFSQKDRFAFGNVNVTNYNTVKLPLLSTLGYSCDLKDKIESFSPNIIHVQGLWMFHSLAALRYKKRHPNVKIIVEPHGMLDPWAIRNSAWKKKIVGYWFEYKNLRNADCIHALCESEKESIENFGLKNKIVVIPNGISIPKAKIDWKFKDKSILFIGRLHPKKGIAQLIKAVNLIYLSNPELINGWTFKIAGWNQLNHQQELQELVKKYSLSEYFDFIGPVFGEQKEKEFLSAQAFILPSFSEGLPMSILEAWSYGLPTIMTPFCNLPIGYESGASIHIATTPESIKDGIIKFLSLKGPEIIVMSQSAFNIVNKHFTWDTIATNTLNIYNQLLKNV